MTSKSLFFRRMKQDLEQRIWLPVIFFILAFLFLELPLISSIDSWQRLENYAEYVNTYLMNRFFSPGYAFTVITIGMAAVSALSGFTYMHSAKKLDVYHSLPVRRETLFVQQYVYGMIYYLVPMVIHVLLCLVICMANGLFGTAVLWQALWHILVQLLIYWSVYSVVITAVCLTGTLVVSVLGSVILMLYSLIVSLLKMSLMDRFFVTYYSLGDNIPAITPIHLITKMIEEMNWGDAEYLVYTDYMGYYVKLLMMAVIYTVIALLLYKKRPSEAAGRAIAFPVMEPVVKTMVVLPASIVSGFFFSSIFSVSAHFSWFVFGCVFGFVICCPLMDIIFQKDMKAAFSKPLQFVFNGACIVGIIVIFQFDLFGYDTYIPKKEKVESYAISLNGFSEIYLDYGNYYNYCLNNMEITDNESAGKLLEHAAEITRPVRTGALEAEEDGADRYTSLLVKFHLKNGKCSYRNYLINIGDTQVMQWLGDVYNDPEYKAGAYPVLAETHETDNYVGILLDYTYASEGIQLSKEEMGRFVETYREELQNLTFDEVLTEYPVANLSFAKSNSDGADALVQTEHNGYSKGLSFDYSSTISGYKIYSSFTQTLALLKEYGADIANEILPEDVVSIWIADYSQEVYRDNIDFAEVEYTQENGQLTKIEQILPCLIRDNLNIAFDAADKTEQDMEVRVVYKYDGKTYEDYFCIVKDRIPQFLREDLKGAAQ